jgi:hypothetical protein
MKHSEAKQGRILVIRLKEHFRSAVLKISSTVTIFSLPGYFMNCCRETTQMGVPPGNRRVLVPRRN